MTLKLQSRINILEAGVDEAGRGCLAGPVVAAAVILPKKFHATGLTDSKQISHEKRMELREIIMEEALAWNVGIVSNSRIDQVNILNATFEAMREAIDGLPIQPEHLLIDGKFYPKDSRIPFRCEVKGDGRFLNIAAASVLAKTFRDEIMEMLALEHPTFDWAQNKGYGTPGHFAAILKNGVTHWHRKSFTLYRPLKLFS